jgi:nucleotide-binding universal stress UspA family protein
MLPIHTILCPTDFSRCSTYALATAAALAHDQKARLIVLHVYRRPAAEPDEAYDTDLANRLHRLPEADPDDRVEHLLVAGTDPAPVILDVARETSCDLIVMGTHGRRRLRKMLLGSVAERVSAEAGCPVLTVRPPICETEGFAGSLADPPVRQHGGTTDEPLPRHVPQPGGPVARPPLRLRAERHLRGADSADSGLPARPSP